MKYFLLVFFCWVSFCNNAEIAQDLNETGSLNVKTIRVDISQAEPIYLSQFVSEIKYFNLNIPDDQPVGRIEKIISKNGLLAFFDTLKRSVWIFDEQGNYINEITIPYGKGPGEAEALSDIYFTDSHQVHVVGLFKILVFDRYGVLVSDLPLHFKVNKINYDEERNLYYGYIGVSINAKVSDAFRGDVLYLFDNEGTIVESYFPIGKGKQGILYSPPSNFPEYGDEKYFFRYLTDTVYVMEDAQPVAAYAIDYGENTIPKEVFERRKKYGSEIWQWTEFWKAEITTRNYLYALTNFEQSARYIHFRTGNRNNYFQILYDKKSDSVFVAEHNFINDIDYGFTPFIYMGDDEFLYSYIEANDFLRHMNKMYKDEKEKYASPKMKRLRELAYSLSDNNNPILVRLRLKE